MKEILLDTLRVLALAVLIPIDVKMIILTYEDLYIRFKEWQGGLR